MKPMKKRDVVAALLRYGCRLLRNVGDHEVWVCPCGQHRDALPRHREISAGVVSSLVKKMVCLPKGWLQ